MIPTTAETPCMVMNFKILSASYAVCMIDNTPCEEFKPTTVPYTCLSLARKDFRTNSSFLYVSLHQYNMK